MILYRSENGFTLQAITMARRCACGWTVKSWRKPMATSLTRLKDFSLSVGRRMRDFNKARIPWA